MTQHYTRISTNVDILISKHGSQKTADIIESMALAKTIDLCTIDLQKAIIQEVSKQFKINIKLLETSDATIYKQARKSCFYLLNKHATLSHAQIRQKFTKLNKTKSYVGHYIQQMKSIIETPNVDKLHHKIHVDIETTIIKFITTKREPKSEK